MLTCRQATQLLSERQDRPLVLHEKMALGLHTRLCPACRRFGQQMVTLSALAKQYRQYNSPPHTGEADTATKSPDLD